MFRKLRKMKGAAQRFVSAASEHGAPTEARGYTAEHFFRSSLSRKLQTAETTFALTREGLVTAGEIVGAPLESVRSFDLVIVRAG